MDVAPINASAVRHRVVDDQPTSNETARGSGDELRPIDVMARIAARRSKLAVVATTDRGLRRDGLAFEEAMSRLALLVEGLPTGGGLGDRVEFLCDMTAAALHAQDCLDGVEALAIRYAAAEPMLVPWEEESPGARLAESVDLSALRHESVREVRLLAGEAAAGPGLGLLHRLARVSGLMALSLACERHPAAVFFSQRVQAGCGQLLKGRERRSVRDLLDDAHPSSSWLLMRCIAVVADVDALACESSSAAGWGARAEALESAHGRFLDAGMCLLRGWEGLGAAGFVDPPSPDLRELVAEASRLVALIDVVDPADCQEASLDSGVRATGSLVRAVIEETWEVARGDGRRVPDEVVGHQCALALRNVLAALARIDVLRARRARVVRGSA
jgi:hypothetical protein